jgi:hypothetical protein
MDVSFIAGGSFMAQLGRSLSAPKFLGNFDYGYALIGVPFLSLNVAVPPRLFRIAESLPQLNSHHSGWFSLLCRRQVWFGCIWKPGKMTRGLHYGGAAANGGSLVLTVEAGTAYMDWKTNWGGP